MDSNEWIRWNENEQYLQYMNEDSVLTVHLGEQKIL
jgi:hypothetical protein